VLNKVPEKIKKYPPFIVVPGFSVGGKMPAGPKLRSDKKI
jgi:hypothetical protein